MLQQSGVLKEAGSAGTILVRLATLWFAVAVGLAALAALNKSFPARNSGVTGGGESTVYESSTRI